MHFVRISKFNEYPGFFLDYGHSLVNQENRLADKTAFYRFLIVAVHLKISVLRDGLSDMFLLFQEAHRQQWTTLLINWYLTTVITIVYLQLKSSEVEAS